MSFAANTLPISLQEKVKRTPIPGRLWSSVIVGYATLLPKELGFELQGAALHPWRIAAILVLPLVIRSLIKEPLRFSLVDLAAGFVSLWFVVALLTTEGTGQALTVGLSQVIDAGLIYLAGRAAIRSHQDFFQFMFCMIPGLVCVGIILAAESISGRIFLRPFFGDLLGKPVSGLYSKPRFGMVRAIGPYSHPIMAGVASASLIAMSWSLPKNTTSRYLGLFAASCGVFTLSSTTVLASAFCLLFIALIIVRRHLKLPAFTIFMFYLLLAFAIISLVSENGLVSFLIRRMTLDAGSGYYRLLIWHYAGVEALAHPVFGIGLRDWERPSWMFSPTIDAFWLVQAMRYGFPMIIGLLAMLLGAIWEALRGTSRVPFMAADPGYGLAIAVAGFAFCGVSVHIWEGASSWMFLVVGLATSLGTQRFTATANATQVQPNASGKQGSRRPYKAWL